MRHCYASLSSGWTYIETDSTSSFLRTSGSFPSLCTSICPVVQGAYHHAGHAPASVPSSLRLWVCSGLPWHSSEHCQLIHPVSPGDSAFPYLTTFSTDTKADRRRLLHDRSIRPSPPSLLPTQSTSSSPNTTQNQNPINNPTSRTKLQRRLPLLPLSVPHLAIGGYALTIPALSANYRIILGLALAAYAFGGMYIQDWFFPPTRDEHVESPMSVRVIDKPRPQPS